MPAMARHVDPSRLSSCVCIVSICAAVASPSSVPLHSGYSSPSLAPRCRAGNSPRAMSARNAAAAIILDRDRTATPACTASGAKCPCVMFRIGFHDPWPSARAHETAKGPRL
eukprot:6182449-Pleurochrysis_carterae.AAC.1